MQKIRESSMYKAGNGGIAISIPKVFIDDNRLLEKDKVEIYRDTIDGKDVLIVIPKSKVCDMHTTAEDYKHV